MPVVAMMVYGTLASNTMNCQLPSTKMPWMCSTIAMRLGVAINSDQRKRLTTSPRWEEFQDTNPKHKSGESNVLHTTSSPPTLIYLSKHLPSFESKFILFFSFITIEMCIPGCTLERALCIPCSHLWFSGRGKSNHLHVRS